MEGAVNAAPVVQYLTKISAPGEFTLVDLGCAGGIDQVWRQFGHRLRAIGIDPNVDEIKRLREAETLPGVRYVAGYAGLPEDHPFRRAKGELGHWSRNPWSRLSTAKSIELLRKKELTSQQRTDANLWNDVDLAEKAQTLFVPEYLHRNNINSVDFLKIDVDGQDFDILNSFDTALGSLGVLGAGLEVNFFGSELPTDHTFHNTDRFMKAHGFELFSLSVRHYSMAALPARYVYSLPAQTVQGRIIQGDALYFRDLAAPENVELATSLGPLKLLNLACAFAVCGLPDCAADVVVTFADSLASFCPVDQLLDLLAEQAQHDADHKLSYKQLMQRFEQEDPRFFPPQS